MFRTFVPQASMEQVLINMSGVCREEGFSPCRDCDSVSGTFIDLSAQEGTNCYCSRDSVDVIRDALSSVPLSTVHWIDTGDYHYLTKFFLERIDRPFQLVLFDNHTDRQEGAFGGVLSCGSWVKDALRDCPFLKNVWTVGTNDGSELAPGLPVYLSIDLDVLSVAEFSTDWSQGTMSLPELCASIKSLVSAPDALVQVSDARFPATEILGIDICGGLTRAKGASDCQLEHNRAVRESLSSFIDNVLSENTRG